MKKLLLLAAVAATSLGASAQTFGEIFEVKDENGQIIENGGTIVIDSYKDFYDGQYIDMGLFSLQSGCTFWAYNINEEPYQLAYEYYRSEPTTEVVPAGQGGFGTFSGCYDVQTEEGGSLGGQCLPSNDGEVSYIGNLPDVPVGGRFQMLFHQENFTSLDPVTVHFTFYVIEAEEKLEGAQFDLNLKFTHLYDTTSVAGIDAESADTEIYNMQGVRVLNPVKGQLYIMRQGGKIAKVIL